MDSTPFQIAAPLRTVTWQGYEADAAVRLVLVARGGDTSATLDLIDLPSSTGGRSHLAALVDHDDRVIEWLELCIHDPEALLGSPAARCGIISNALLDAEWHRWVEVTRELNPSDTITAPWEKQPRAAWAIDAQRGCVRPLLQPETQQAWALCQDDAKLQAASLALYSSSTERWFCAPAADGATAWISSAELRKAGKNPSTTAVLADGAAWLPLNLSGGQMILRRYRPVALEAFAQALRTGGTDTTAASAAPGAQGPLELIAERMLTRWRGEASGPVRLFETDTVLESLYLGLALWQNAVQATLDACVRLGRPFLNLAPDSFHVALPPPNSLVPPTWSFQVALVKPGEAAGFPENSPLGQRFVPYRGVWDEGLRERFGGWRVGSGTARLSQIFEAEGSQSRLEGFLDGSGLRDADKDALVWVYLPFEGDMISFVATVEAEQNRRTGVRFKANVGHLEPSVLTRLRTTAMPRRPCQFCLLHPVSPTFDVHSLGQIGIKILFPQIEEAVLEFEDDLFELASLLPQRWNLEHFRFLAKSRDISPRLQRLLDAEVWLPTAGKADAVPADLWHAIIRELMEFVTVEDEPEDGVDPLAASDAWLTVLRRRCASLSSLALHVRGLLTAPRPAHEDIARVVQRFARAGRKTSAPSQP